MDYHYEQVVDQENRWMLHKNAADGPKCELEVAHDQPCALWQATKG